MTDFLHCVSLVQKLNILDYLLLESMKSMQKCTIFSFCSNQILNFCLWQDKTKFFFIWSIKIRVDGYYLDRRRLFQMAKIILWVQNNVFVSIFRCDLWWLFRQKIGSLLIFIFIFAKCSQWLLEPLFLMVRFTFRIIWSRLFCPARGENFSDIF